MGDDDRRFPTKEESDRLFLIQEEGATADDLEWQTNKRLERAAVACPAWEDGQHCWSEDRSRPNSRTLAKSCVCGAELRRRDQ